MEPCDQRSKKQCETELTKGQAPWDVTTNVCFYDQAQGRCRFSDECFALDARTECTQQGCHVETLCTPADMRSKPGPNVCKKVCAQPPRRSAVNASNGTEAAAPLLPPRLSSPRPSSSPMATRPEPSAGGPEVTTTSGKVRGLTAEGVWLAFKQFSDEFNEA